MNSKIQETLGMCLRRTENYEEFEDSLKRIKGAKASKIKGDLQELLVKLFFLSNRVQYKVLNYYSRVLDPIPDDLKDLVAPIDVGTDGYIRHTDGTFSLVQVKFRSNPTTSMVRDYITRMTCEAGPLKDIGKLKHLYLVSNTFNIPRNVFDKEIASHNIKFITSETLLQIDWEGIQKQFIEGDDYKIVHEFPSLHEWQRRMVEALFKNGLQFGRKTVISPCGSGKSILYCEIVKNYDRCLIIVPTLHLLNQAFEIFAKYEPDRPYLLVGSDMDGDSNEAVNTTHEITTDPEKIGEFLENETGRLIVISTYKSLDKIDKMFSFDITVCDEAHLCCSNIDSYYTIPVQDDFPCYNRLFLTATPKIYRGDNGNCFSMDDESKFGQQFVYSFKDAINDNIISDYRIVTGYDIVDLDNPIEDKVFAAKFLFKAVTERNIQSVLVFSVNHKMSREHFEEAKKMFEGSEWNLILMPENAKTKSKIKAVQAVKNGKRVMIFNVRVFDVGSDIPELEAVMMLGNRNSTIGIVQSVSRCLRKSDNKDKGTILIPCLIRGDEIDSDGNYENLRTFLVAMKNTDEALSEEVALRANGGERRDLRRVEFLDLREKSEEAQSNISVEDFEIKVFEGADLSLRSFGIRISKWETELKNCEDFVKRTGRSPNRDSDDPREKKMCTWIGHQKIAYKRVKFIMVHMEARKLWEEFLFKYPMLRDKLDDWRRKKNIFIEFREKEGRLPNLGKNSTVEEKKLASWVTGQKRKYKLNFGLMKDEAIKEEWEEVLDKYPELLIIDELEEWRTIRDEVTEFFQRENRFPRREDPNESVMSLWLYRQRVNYRKTTGLMKNAAILVEWEEFLVSFPFLRPKDVERDWKESLKGVLSFYAQNGVLPRTSYGSLASKEEQKLGDWLSDQRKNYITKTKTMSDEYKHLRDEWEKVLIDYPFLRGRKQ